MKRHTKKYVMPGYDAPMLDYVAGKFSANAIGWDEDKLDIVIECKSTS